MRNKASKARNSTSHTRILTFNIPIAQNKDLKKTDPYPNLVKYSPDVLKKKTKVLDIINTNKTCFIKISVESRYGLGSVFLKKKDPHHWLFL